MSSLTNYRNDIDFLRAISVALVILYHTGINIFSGSFVGVDVFFVISGFLIGQIILELPPSRNRFSFSLAFLEKRLRRVYPALVVVCFVATVPAFFLLTPHELKSFGQSLVATNFFLNDFLLSVTSDYFEQNTSLKPLMHSWSLGVEIQFYILIAILIAIFPMPHIALTVYVVFSLILISLFIYVEVPYIKSDYFFSLTRYWEFSAGIFSAAIRKAFASSLKTSRFYICDFLSIFGLTLIFFVAFSEEADHFGLSLLLVALGSSLFLVFGDRCKSLIAELFNIRCVVGFGIISYGVYLWHQVLFAYWKIWKVSPPSTVEFFLLVIVTICCAVGTYFLVEQPFRRKGLISSRQFFSIGILCSVLFLLVGLNFHFSRGLPQRFPAEILEITQIQKADWSILSSDCENPSLVDELDEILGVKVCYLNRAGNNNRKFDWLIYGDSHAESIAESIVKLANEKGKIVARVSIPDCHIIWTLFYDPNSVEVFRNCEDRVANLKRLVTYVQPELAILHLRWAMQLSPLPGGYEPSFFDNGEGGVEIHPGVSVWPSTIAQGSRDDYTLRSGALIQFVEDFQEITPQVFIIGPVPEVGWNVVEFAFRHYLKTGRTPLTIDTNFDRYYERHRFFYEVITPIVERTDSTYLFDPSTHFCKAGDFEKRCTAMANGKYYYFDDDHLSKVGADNLVQQWAKNSSNL